MADQFLEQADFSGGIFRGRKAPANAVYDAINGLVNDEGDLFRRAGTVYPAAYSSPAGSQLLGAAHVHFDVLGASQLITWTASTWNGDASGTLTPPRAYTRGVGVGGLWVAPASGSTYDLVYYGGHSPVSDNYTTGTVDVDAGVADIVGTGTSWTSNVSPGMIVVTAQTALGVVKSVFADNEIILREPWAGVTQTGLTYKIVGAQRVTPIDNAYQGVTCVAAVGTPQRLIACVGNRAYFTPPGNPYDFPAGYYHELPDNALIVGAEGVGDTCVLFTTAGVWRISNMNFDPFDDAGNLQHTVTRISKDVLLWGDPGIVGWAGGLIVPTISDVTVMGVDGQTTPVSENIRPLYRQYVEAGYQPGTAAVFRSHYLLPILNGTTLVDVLVCRLDRGSAWTRWSGHAACGAYVTAVGAEEREPVLYGVNGTRIVELTGCFTPGEGQDANLSNPVLTVETRDFDLVEPGRRRPGTVEMAEVTYESAGSMAVSWAAGEEGSSYTGLTAVRGGGVSDGSDVSVWRVGKARRSLRLKLVTTGLLRKVVLRVRRAGA